MKFRNWLLEEETGKSVIMYHGTSMALWPKIKQNGLQAFPDNRSWAADPHAGFSTASRASYGGIYLTVNVITATGAAFRTAKPTDSNRLLLAVQVDPRTLVADEDQLTFAVGKVPIPGVLTTEFTAASLYSSWFKLKSPEYLKYMSQWQGALAEERQYVQKAIDAYIKHAYQGIQDRAEGLMNPVLEKKVKQVLKDVGFEAALGRLVAYVDDRTKESADSRRIELKVDWPEKHQAEEKYKNFVDYLTKLLRKLSDPSIFKGLMHAGRSLRDIGFEGRNKIVYAAEIRREPYMASFGESKRDVLYRLYGEPPAELIKQWQEREGEWIEKGNNEEV